MGDPERPLLWVSKSYDKLAPALADLGHAVSPNSVRKLLTGLGFSRQFNRKADEGSSHPDRDAQFEHINAKVTAAQAAGQPVISVDTKKKELVGDFKNGGSDYRPKGDPRACEGARLRGQGAGQGARPTGSTMWPPTRAGSASGSPPTRRVRRPRPSAPGCDSMGRERYPQPAS